MNIGETGWALRPEVAGRSATAVRSPWQELGTGRCRNPVGPAMSVIRARTLTKICPQGHVGVCGLDRAVEPGAVFGFLGPNGADKTPPCAA